METGDFLQEGSWFPMVVTGFFSTEWMGKGYLKSNNFPFLSHFFIVSKIFNQDLEDFSKNF